jgi:hypothetical protein
MKRFFSSLLIFAIIFTMLPAGAWATENPVPDRPLLKLVSTNSVRVEADSRTTVSIELENFGTISATDIVASLYSDSTGAVIVTGGTVKPIASINAGSKGKVNFSIDIDSDVAEGTYTLPYSVVYFGTTVESEPSEEEESEPTSGSAITTATKYELSGTINVRVSSAPVTVPDLLISKVDLIPAIVLPGQDFVAGFEIENNGDGPARDIKVTLGGLSSETFSLRTVLGTKTITSISRGRKAYVSFELKASKGLTPGSYPVTLNMTYKNDKGEVIGPQSEQINIQVGSNLEQASTLLLQNISYPSGPLGQNKEVKVTFEIRNQGQSVAKKVVIKAESTDTTGLVPKSLSTAKIEAIAPGEVVSLQFLFLTAPNASTSNYPINITVEYTDDLASPGSRDPISQMIGIFVNAPTPPDGNANLSTPKLIIDKYSFNPVLVEAGKNFEMFLSFYNTNSSRSVRNIKIFLTAEEETDSGSVFTPVNSSNTFYIDSIAPKGRVEKTITMFTIPDAKAKTYTITAHFEYEDSAANPYQAQEFIGIPVIQQSRLETGEIGYFPESYVGQSTPISLEFYNTGKVTLYNMMVKLEGDFQTENGQYYVGNFNSGSSEYFEGYVIPSQPGELTGDIVFTFEDSTGQMQELRKPFALNVMDMMPMPEYPGEYPPIDEPRPGGTGGWQSFLLPGAIGLAAIIGGIVFYRKRKAKKVMKEMEIDE